MSARASVGAEADSATLAAERACLAVITAYADLETAVSAVRSGAFDYVVKPFDAGPMERATAERSSWERSGRCPSA